MRPCGREPILTPARREPSLLSQGMMSSRLSLQVPPSDLVNAGGRVAVEELDMESLARQSASFSLQGSGDVSQQQARCRAQTQAQPSSPAGACIADWRPCFFEQMQQLQLRLAAEQQCVLREQHITARMWIEKSQARSRRET